MSASDDALGHTLLALARHAIADELGIAHAADPNHPALRQPGATFVTLTKDDHLRGCIGSLEARRALSDDVRANARAAAFLDSRFPPLDREEFPAVRVEVSLLSAAQPIVFASEDEALQQLRPHVDGVVLEYGGHRATFLPQVWESLPSPHQFMAELKRKAGLPVEFWNKDIKLSRYEVQRWKE